MMIVTQALREHRSSVLGDAKKLAAVVGNLNGVSLLNPLWRERFKEIDWRREFCALSSQVGLIPDDPKDVEELIKTTPPEVIREAEKWLN